MRRDLTASFIPLPLVAVDGERAWAEERLAELRGCSQALVDAVAQSVTAQERDHLIACHRRPESEREPGLCRGCGQWDDIHDALEVCVNAAPEASPRIEYDRLRWRTLHLVDAIRHATYNIEDDHEVARHPDPDELISSETCAQCSEWGRVWEAIRRVGEHLSVGEP